MKFNRALFIFILAIQGNAFALATASSEENKIFDNTHQSPVRLMTDLYKKNQILILGESNHDNYKVYAYLKELLDLVGEDPELKFIALERPSDASEFFQDLSIRPLTEVLEKFHFKSDSAKENTLCLSSEWARSIADFFPYLRVLNKKRIHRGLQPILVKTFDSVPSDQGNEMSGPTKTVKDGTCHLAPTAFTSHPDAKPVYLTLFQASGNREQQTAENFKQQIRKGLRPSNKIILMYHYLHVIKGFESCMPFLDSMNDPDEWTARWTKSNWFELFAAEHPQIRKRSKIIAFDEISDTFAPKGNFLVTQRQVLRHPDIDFAFNLSQLKNIETEKGMDVFSEGALIKTYHGGQHRSEFTLPQMFDAVVWSHDAQLKYQYDLRNPAHYLPEYCGKKN